MDAELWTPDEIVRTLPTSALRAAFCAELGGASEHTVAAVLHRWAETAQRWTDAVSTASPATDQVAAGTFDWGSAAPWPAVVEQQEARRAGPRPAAA